MSVAIAIDLGSSTGRLISITKQGEELIFEIIKKFDNKSEIATDGHLHWDYDNICNNIKETLDSLDFREEDSVSVDSWGVDYVLLDKATGTFPLPFHYRDTRTDDIPVLVEKILSNKELYALIGLQLMSINTIYQLIAEHKKEGIVLMTPDFINYMLSGAINAEMSISSTTGLFNPNTMNWDKELIKKVGLEGFTFPEVSSGIKKIGTYKNNPNLSVISGLGHDTAAAIAAVPNEEEDFLFISSGTWSLLGTVLDKPITTTYAQESNITNEICYDKKIAFMKNITGLWILQELRKEWNSSFDIMEKEASEAEPFKCFLDTDDDRFMKPGNMETKIKEYMAETNQPVPMTKGEIVRCVNESLAMKYKLTEQQIKKCTGKQYSKLYIIGGGSKSFMLCQMTADALNMETSIGPVEATSYGNALAQFIAKGEIKDIKEAKGYIRKLKEIKTIHPSNTELWDRHFDTFQKVTNLK